MKNFILKLISVLSIIFFLNGCVMKESYPKEWGEVNYKRNTPLLINGTFKCEGKHADNSYKPYLPSSLGLKIIDNQKCDTINIKQSDSTTIKATLLYEDNTTLETSLNLETDYFYENNQLYIKGQKECASTNGIIICNSSKKQINLTTNKDLAIEWINIAGGTVFLVIPVGGYENGWSLFKNENH